MRCCERQDVEERENALQAAGKTVQCNALCGRVTMDDSC